jgi:hypothetical protein
LTRAPAPTAAKPSALQNSLGLLGIPVTGGQIVGFIVATIAGLVIARILPYVYFVFDPLLTAVFGSGPSYERDGFNTFMMTAITFLTSFGLALVSAWLARPRPKKRT